MDNVFKDEDNRFVRNAKFRVAAIAHINKLDTFESGGEILKQLKPLVEELGLSHHQVLVQLRDLGDAGLVQIKHEGKDCYYAGKGIRPDIGGFSGTQWKKQAILAVAQDTGSKAEVFSQKPQLAKVAAKVEPAVKLDIVKNTGKLRITFQGVVLEIGVVDK